MSSNAARRRIKQRRTTKRPQPPATPREWLRSAILPRSLAAQLDDIEAKRVLEEVADLCELMAQHVGAMTDAFLVIAGWFLSSDNMKSAARRFVFSGARSYTWQPGRQRTISSL